MYQPLAVDQQRVPVEADRVRAVGARSCRARARWARRPGGVRAGRSPPLPPSAKPSAAVPARALKVRLLNTMRVLPGHGDGGSPGWGRARGSGGRCGHCPQERVIRSSYDDHGAGGLRGTGRPAEECGTPEPRPGPPAPRRPVRRGRGRPARSRAAPGLRGGKGGSARLDAERQGAGVAGRGVLPRAVRVRRPDAAPPSS